MISHEIIGTKRVGQPTLFVCPRSCYNYTMEKNEIVCDLHSIAVDIVIFSIIKDQINVLLIERVLTPTGWAIPGGFVKTNESLDDAAKRELAEETGVSDVYLEQLYTFGNPKRDPRGRVVSVAYFALVESEKVKLKAGSDAKKAEWYPVEKLPTLAFDHKEIISYAKRRLAWKIEYTNVAYGLLPKYFTLTQLQKVYEAIIGRKLDKRNFRRKFLSTGLIKQTKIKEEGAHRPAALFEFSERKPQFIKNPFGQFLNK